MIGSREVRSRNPGERPREALRTGNGLIGNRLFLRRQLQHITLPWQRLRACRNLGLSASEPDRGRLVGAPREPGGLGEAQMRAGNERNDAPSDGEPAIAGARNTSVLRLNHC